MFGMNRLLLLASSLLLVSSAFGSIDASAQKRILEDGSISSVDSSEDGMSMAMMRKKGGKGGSSVSSASSVSSGSSKDSGKGSTKGELGDSEDMVDSSSKGKGGSKGSKKSDKSSKKASKKDSKKNSKKGSDKSPSMPSQPTPSTPTTPSPTSANSIPVRPLPFSLAYTIEGGDVPTEADWAQVTDVTRVYLEEFMIDEFSQTSLTNLDDFLTVLERKTVSEATLVPRGIYRSVGLFNPSSIFLPTVRELNDLLDSAFKGDNLDEYLRRVRSLPNGNAFSNTVGINKGLDLLPPQNGERINSGGSGYVKAGVGAAAAGVVVLAAGLLLLKRKGSADELEDPFAKDYGRNLKGDATIADETCNMSLDGSTAWRKESPYADNDADLDDDFEDEPLDNSDDEGTPAQTSRRHPPSKAFHQASAMSLS